MALISGEAGVGKTRLATHLALQVRAEGATVLYGRCDEDLGVPYQPWVQALGHLVKEAPQPILDAHVERLGGDLARLVPALGDRVPDLPSPRESDPETERYLLYAAVAGLLEGAGEAGAAAADPRRPALGRSADAVAAAPPRHGKRLDAADGDRYLPRLRPPA